MRREDVIECLRTTGIIPVVVLKNLEDTFPVLRALADGGIGIAEITFRTDCAEEAIRRASEQMGKMLIGAGTVVNAEQCERAIGAGAKFIVSPGFSEDVAKLCLEKNILYVPGTVTPTEIMTALSFGIRILKYFPAENYGGLKSIKALSAAFPQVLFVPTGGINANNLETYLSFEKIVACGGSWMLKGNADDIKISCEEAMNIVKKVRG